jgi:hypothetical protein
MPTKKLPPLISYRHQKCWRVIFSYEDDHGSVVHDISKRMTYCDADALLNRITAKRVIPDMGHVIMCYIVAESDGIERR